MNVAPKGKIGRLPKAIQEQVNRRLENSEKGRPMVAWLNSLPEVQAVLAAEFASQPIRQQNLSKWRKFGYKQWLWHQQALAMTQEMTSPLNQPVPDQMAGWVTARYLFAIRQLVENRAGGEPDFKTPRTFLHDVVAVRRGDHSGTRLQLASERLADKRRETKGDPREFIAASALSGVWTTRP